MLFLYWHKLISSINYFINRDVWGESLLDSNEDLLQDYLDIALDEEDGVYSYLDKKSFEYIELSDDDLEKVKKTFLERIEKKKLKYVDELEDIRSNKIFREAKEYLTDELERENKLTGFKVIEFSKKK